MRSGLKSSLFVLLQFSLMALLLLLSHPLSANLFSLLLMSSGALLGVWAVLVMGIGRFNIRPDVRQDARLVSESLPYAWIRHPMYSSVMLFCAGLLFAPLTPLKLGLWAALCVVLWFKARFEEQLLSARFADYAAYQARSKRFVPFVL